MTNIFSQMAKQIQNGISLALDMSQTLHLDYYREQLARHNINENSHPELLKSIAPGNYQAHQGPTPIDIISKLDTTNGQHYSASVLSSIPHGVDSCTLTIELQDANQKCLGRNTQQISGGGKDVILSVDGGFSTPPPKEGRQLTTVATCHYHSDEGTHITTTHLTTFSHPANIELNIPKDTTGDSTINIGISGSGSGSGCDYTSPAATSQVAIPLKGEVEYYNNIKTSNGKPTNATCNLKMFNTEDGQAAMAPISSFDFFNHPNTVVNGTKLSWDLDWVEFDQVRFNAKTGVYLVMIINVEVEQTSPVQVTAIISNTPNTDPKQYWNTLKISPMNLLATGFPPVAASMKHNGYMQANSISAYNFNKGPFTVEAWINAASSGTIISRKSTEGGFADNSGFLFVLKSDGVLKLATDNGFGFYEINTVRTNIIGSGARHVAATRDKNGNLHIYLDGQLLPSSPNHSLSTPLAINTYLPMVIGATDQIQEPYNHYTGSLCLVRVWNVQRTIDEIALNAPVILPADSKGLVAQWPLLGNGSDDSSAQNAMTTVGEATFG